MTTDRLIKGDASPLVLGFTFLGTLVRMTLERGFHALFARELSRLLLGLAWEPRGELELYRTECLWSCKGFRLVIDGRLVKEAKAGRKRMPLSIFNILQARDSEMVWELSTGHYGGFIQEKRFLLRWKRRVLYASSRGCAFQAQDLMGQTVQVESAMLGARAEFAGSNPANLSLLNL